VLRLRLCDALFGLAFALALLAVVQVTLHVLY
jgi:hypothetical protein